MSCSKQEAFRDDRDMSGLRGMKVVITRKCMRNLCGYLEGYPWHASNYPLASNNNCTYSARIE